MESIKFTIIGIFLIFIYTNTRAQDNNYLDEIHFKNGTSIIGSIIETSPNNYVKLKSENGTIYTFEYSEINQIVKKETSSWKKDFTRIYVPISSAIIALVAVILSPIISMKIAKLQFNSNVLSKNRQDWINTLRECVSELLAIMQVVSIKGSGPANDELFQRSLLLMSKIELLINPKEQDHALLVETIHNTVVSINKIETKEEVIELCQKIDSITNQSQKILKREWERVKAGI